ncbi:hypothetical protein GCM10009821_20770 [Aeromicrobium halocynthiae]|uniref:DUF3566 domain-containing protein n=1 Tax=Aeromicrobium halocynthiae TaxID=560557 RepID=A0ABN2W1M1_9ACTN
MTSNAKEPANSSSRGPAKSPAKGAARPASTGASPASRSSAKKEAPTSPPQKKAPATKAPQKKPAAKKAPASEPAKQPTAGTAPTRTPTAGDYAKTTQDSAESTAVIPAVQEKPKAAPTQKPAPAATSDAAAAARRARLQLVRVEPWSVTRLAFVVSVAMMIVAVVAVTIFWVVLDLAGVWDQLNGSIATVLSDGEAGFDLTDYFGLGRLVGLTLVLSAINVIVFTMMATIAAHLYNLAAQLMGGIGITFQDR